MAEAAQHRHRSCREQQGLQVKLLPLSSRAGGKGWYYRLEPQTYSRFCFQSRTGWEQVSAGRRGMGMREEICTCGS